jgi:hypothetical protein
MAHEDEYAGKPEGGSVTDVLARTTLALLRSLAPTNAFLLARLSGRPERDIARALAELERQGLASVDNNRWVLTSQGALEARRSQAQSDRSAGISQCRIGRHRATGKLR